MRKIYFIIATTVILTIVSCDGRLANVLEESGKNRGELVEVLEYYKNDTLKREAAMFLIENMSGKYFYTGELIDKYDTLFSIYDSLHKSGNHAHNPPVIRRAMKKLQEQYGSLEPHRLTLNKDCRYLSSEYLIQNIDWAVKAWQTNPLLRLLDFSTFCEYILPYRAGREYPDVYRERFYNEFHVLRDTCANDTTALLKAFRQAIYTDRYFGQSQTMWQYSIDPSVNQMIRGRKGSCDHTCNLYTWIMRSCGIPIAIDYVMNWGNRGMGHSWNVLILENGRTFPFDPFTEKKATLKYKPAKIFRRMYSTNWLPDDVPTHKDVPAYLISPSSKDVTHEYVPTFDVKLKCDYIPIQKSIRYAVICTFGDKAWQPIYWGTINNEIVNFKNMAADVCYMAAYYHQGELTPLTKPFILTKEGEIKKIGENLSVKGSITVNRKYPRFQRMDILARKLMRTTIEAANNKEFRNADTLMEINNVPTDVNDSMLSCSRKYRYVRCHIPNYRTGDLAEIIFYGKQSMDSPEIRLEGNIIGFPLPDKRNTMPYFMAMDGDPNTYFVKTKGNDGYVGLDLGVDNKHYITRVQFYPRSDANYILIGDTYELCYWQNKQWISIGKQTAVSHKLTFDNVPQKELYILHNLTRGTEERPFTYENGKQVWW